MRRTRKSLLVSAARLPPDDRRVHELRVRVACECSCVMRLCECDACVR